MNEELSHKIIGLDHSGLLSVRKLEDKVDMRVQETREWSFINHTALLTSLSDSWTKLVGMMGDVYASTATIHALLMRANDTRRIELSQVQTDHQSNGSSLHNKILYEMANATFMFNTQLQMLGAAVYHFLSYQTIDSIACLIGILPA